MTISYFGLHQVAAPFPCSQAALGLTVNLRRSPIRNEEMMQAEDATTQLKAALQPIVDDLLREAKVSRTTIRVNIPVLGIDTTKPIVEARMPGVGSLLDKVRTNQDKSGTMNYLKRERRLLLQEDTKNADPGALPPAQLHEEYGTLAQMMAGLWLDGKFVGFVSAHENRRTRKWTPVEAALMERAAQRTIETISSIARE